MKFHHPPTTLNLTPEQINERCERASGDTPCTKCGLALRHHSLVTNIIDTSTDEPFLTIDCDGNIWKL